MTVVVNGIGTLTEKSLHAALKDWYAGPGDQLEVVVDGFVVDIVRSDLLIEIQTSNFSALKHKLTVLTEQHQVRLVYPVAREKWIVRLNARGRQVGRRKSPKRGRVVHVFDELVRIPTLVTRPNFSVEVLLVQAEQILCNDGKGSWRRQGWSVVDHRLLDVVEQVVMESPGDFRALLPADLPDRFTTRDLADALELQRNLARKMAYCLREMGALEVVGKRRNAIVYSSVQC